MRPFELNGVTYLSGQTQCAMCHKVFTYTYQEGAPLTSLRLCFKCDPALGVFVPTTMVIVHRPGQVQVDYIPMMVMPMG